VSPSRHDDLIKKIFAVNLSAAGLEQGLANSICHVKTVQPVYDGPLSAFEKGQDEFSC